tara:strand:- start:78 stop:635 length:558 start_codon:yes stop_codon:yes gene_type:complete
MENFNSCFAERTCVNAHSYLPKNMLKEIFKTCKSGNYESSKTGDNTSRSSTNAWLYVDSWIAGILHNIMVNVNTDYFHYDLVHFSDNIQVTKYEKNQEYRWHIDQSPMKEKDQRTRKLSISFLVNDNFKGGEFEIYNPVNQRQITIPMQAGSYCVFPSWVVHRVKPVTSGTRYSLVAWMDGPQFK